MTTTIVVGVDGSPDSGLALDWAVAEAALRDARLLVVYAIHMPVVAVPFSGAALVPPSDDLRAYGRQVLDRAEQRARDRAPAVGIETLLVTGRPVDAIRDVARDAELIVVGTRGLSALGSLALGSVSGRLASQATAPTVVVPPDPVDAGGPIVVGVDDSEHSVAALRFALREAALRAAEVVAVHAYRADSLALPIFEPDALATYTAAEREQAETLVNDAVTEATADTGFDGTVTARTDLGHPVDVLVDQSGDAAMVVLGSRGRGGLTGTLLGSVSRGVLHRATRPVAVVRAS